MIGGGIAIASGVLTELCGSLLGLMCLFLAIPWVPLWPIFWSLKTSNTTVFLLTGTTIWFLLGSLIGALVGYIKKKKVTK